MSPKSAPRCSVSALAVAMMVMSASAASVDMGRVANGADAEERYSAVDKAISWGYNGGRALQGKFFATKMEALKKTASCFIVRSCGESVGSGSSSGASFSPSRGIGGVRALSMYAFLIGACTAGRCVSFALFLYFSFWFVAGVCHLFAGGREKHRSFVAPPPRSNNTRCIHVRSLGTTSEGGGDQRRTETRTLPVARSSQQPDVANEQRDHRQLMPPVFFFFRILRVKCWQVLAFFQAVVNTPTEGGLNHLPSGASGEPPACPTTVSSPGSWTHARAA